MREYLIIIYIIMPMFYSLNYQDFPLFFEDHLQELITILNDVILLPNKTSKINTIDPSLYESESEVKTKTIKNINLYYSMN